MPTAVLEKGGRVELREDEEETKPETKPKGSLKPPPKDPPIGIDTATIPPELPKKEGDGND
jgi:hypothetical protein